MGMVLGRNRLPTERRFIRRFYGRTRRGIGGRRSGPGLGRDRPFPSRSPTSLRLFPAFSVAFSNASRRFPVLPVAAAFARPWRILRRAPRPRSPRNFRASDVQWPHRRSTGNPRFRCFGHFRHIGLIERFGRIGRDARSFRTFCNFSSFRHLSKRPQHLPSASRPPETSNPNIEFPNSPPSPRRRKIHARHAEFRNTRTARPRSH